MIDSNVASENGLPVEVRSLIDSDIPFIFNSWLKAYRNAKAVADVNQTIYFNEHHKLVEKLLKRCNTLVIGNAGDPLTVYGYINYEFVQGLFVLHFAYIKHDFRTLGLFKELMKATKHDFSTAGCFTHKLKSAGKLESNWNLIYHPYILINY